MLTVNDLSMQFGPSVLFSRVDLQFTAGNCYGIIGLETAFALGLMSLVAPGYLTMSQLISKMSTEPARLYALEAGAVREDGPADIILFDPEKTWAYLVPQSKATNSPWLGKSLKGKVVMTICGGQIAYEDTRAFGERRLPIGAKLKEI